MRLRVLPRRVAKRPRGWAAVFVALVVPLLLVACSSPAVPANQQPDLPLRWTQVDGRRFPYCGTGSIDDIPAATTRVVFAIHGIDRNACALAAAVRRAVGPDTLVVAPWFPPPAGATNAATLSWDMPGWVQGDDARTGGPSSYEVLDELIGRVGSRRVTVFGFSAGGQFVNRYAAVGRAGVYRYIVANPSSYLYFTPDREAMTPHVLATCPDYNTWRYGVDRLNRVAGDVGVDGLKGRYASRSVTYLIGSDDNRPRAVALDRSCAAMAQGANREQRASRYHRHLQQVFGPAVITRQPLFAVPGVGHDSVGMVTSDAGRRALTG